MRTKVAVAVGVLVLLSLHFLRARDALFESSAEKERNGHLIPSVLDPLSDRAIAAVERLSASPPLERMQTPVAKHDEEPVSVECRRQWEAAARLDMNAFAKIDDSRRLTFTDMKAFFQTVTELGEAYRCTPPSSEPKGSGTPPFLAKCQLAMAGDPLGNFTWDCIHGFLHYRAGAVREMVRGIPLGQINDVDLLAGLYMGEIEDASPWRPIPEPPFVEEVTNNGRYEKRNADEILKRILEIDPKNFDAAVQLLGWEQMAFDMPFPDEEQDKAAKKRFRETLAIAEALAPKDPYVLSCRMELSRWGKSITEWKELAQDLTKAHPDSWVGPYYEAWAAHLENDRGRAKELLAGIVAGERDDASASFHAVIALDILSGKFQADPDFPIFTAPRHAYGYSIHLPEPEILREPAMIGEALEILPEAK